MSNNLQMSDRHANVGLPRRTHDPLRSAASETPTFNRLWLKNGETLRPLQRIGFAIVSLAFLCAAVYAIRNWWEALEEHDLYFILWFGSAAFCLTVGFLGIINTLRFPRPKP